MENTKYETSKQSFQADYKEKAHLQKGFNAILLEAFVDWLLQVIPDAKQRPLKILDLCCGDGGVTTGLLTLLKSNDIKIERLVGYDISPHQISVAKKYEQEYSELSFHIKDVEKLSDENEYDVVLSLFGLHWIENLPEAAKRIVQALKPGGKLMFFVPLEKTELFDLRQKLCAAQPWEEHLVNFKLNPFIAAPKDYIEIFNANFVPFNANTIAGTQVVEFSSEKFMEFLSSWMQEIRKLDNKELSQQYLKTLVDSLPTESGCHDAVLVNKDSSKSVLFYERYLWYFGQRKDTLNVLPSADNEAVMYPSQQ